MKSVRSFAIKKIEVWIDHSTERPNPTCSQCSPRLNNLVFIEFLPISYTIEIGPTVSVHHKTIPVKLYRNTLILLGFQLYAETITIRCHRITKLVEFIGRRDVISMQTGYKAERNSATGLETEDAFNTLRKKNRWSSEWRPVYEGLHSRRCWRGSMKTNLMWYWYEK